MIPKINIEELELGKLVGAGATSDVYASRWRETDVAVKVFKTTYRTRKFGFFGLINLAKHEYRKAEKIKKKFPAIKENILTPVGVSTTATGRKVLISELIKDFDNRPSRQLSEYKEVPENFIKRLLEIVEAVHRTNSFFYDLHENNILVRRDSEKIYTPVIIDLHKFNWRSFHLMLYTLMGTDSGVQRDINMLEGRLKKWLEPLKKN